MAIRLRPATQEDSEAALALEQRVWATFYAEAHGGIGLDYDPILHVVAAEEDGTLVGTADACPFLWSGEIDELPPGGWRDVVANERSRRRRKNPPLPRYACAMGVTVAPEHRGAGLGARLLTALRDAAFLAGYEALAAPVRPSDRWRCPHLTIEEYVALRLPDGRHFDGWLRLHEAAGGTIVGSTEESQYFYGSRKEWERWTGMRLPEDGSVLIDGATLPLVLADGEGWLVEDGIWVLHHPTH